jgi:hypothetical protein
VPCDCKRKRAEIAARIEELSASAVQLQNVRESFDAAPAPVSCRTDLTCCVPPSEGAFVPVELLKLSRPRPHVGSPLGEYQRKFSEAVTGSAGWTYPALIDTVLAH